MPIIGNFPSVSGGSGGGLALAAVSGIQTLTAAGKVYVKWTDPDDLVVADSTLAAWSGTKLIRKAGSSPVSRRDGVEVLDSKNRNAYKDNYFCDSGLTDGVTYYYKFFPYTTANAYTDDPADEFNETPEAVPLGNTTDITTAIAGNGKMAIKWTDPAPAIVSDGVTLATWASTIVVVKSGDYATSPDDPDADYTFTSTTRNAYKNTPLVATGLTNGTTYYVSLFPMSTDGMANTNSANRQTGVANRYTISYIPSQEGSLIYSGNPMTPIWKDYNGEKLVLGGMTTGTNAGTYTATFTPKEDYIWSDGSASAKDVVWSIGKAPGLISLSTSSITLNASALTATVTVNRMGDGPITVSSNDTSVATAFVSGTTITISHVNQTTGTATITVKAEAGTNYAASMKKTISVTTQFLPAKKALNSQTWEEISQISEAGLGSEYWNIGDRKSITINGTVGTLAVNTTLYVYILGFNHNSAKEGSGVQFGTFKSNLSGGTDVCLIDSKYNGNGGNIGEKKFAMNHWGSSSGAYNTNYGGWKGCDARYDILGSTKTAPSGYGITPTTNRFGYDAPADTATVPVANTLMSALPSDLRAVMKPITKYTDNKGGGSDIAVNITSSVDYLPLLSEYEIFGGSRSYANQFEKDYQVQYPYYSAGNSKVKYKHNFTGTAAAWWVRSPYYGDDSYFCYVGSSGSSDCAHSRFCWGFAPVFMV